jgi:hypothetical protein
MNPDFKDLKDFKRQLTESFVRDNRSITWVTPGHDHTFFNAFYYGCKKVIQERKVTIPKVPLSIPQLFLVIFALLPNHVVSFGFSNSSPVPNFFSQVCLLSMLLILADGFRGGEITATLQEN